MAIGRRDPKKRGNDDGYYIGFNIDGKSLDEAIGADKDGKRTVSDREWKAVREHINRPRSGE